MTPILSPLNWDSTVLESGADKYYASVRGGWIGTAREDSRLPEVEVSKIKEVTEEHEVWYALNPPCLGSLTEMEANKDRYVRHLRIIEDMGFRGVIVAHPYLIPLIKRYTGLGIDVSTILEPDSVQKFWYYCDMEVDAITLHQSVHRDFKLLGRLKDFPVEFIMIMNTACIFHCPWRISHYNIQGHSTEMCLTSDYPYELCREVTTKNFPLNILKANWVRPEDLRLYDEYGLTTKISGRTMTTGWILQTVKAYKERKFDGENFFSLFPMVRGSLKKAEGETELFLSYRALDGFLEEIKKRSPNCRADCRTRCAICYRWALSLEEKGEATGL